MFSAAILTEKRQTLLEKLPGFQNLVDPWESTYASLKKWLEKHNGVYPDIDSTDEEEKRLALWLQKEIEAYRQAKGCKQCEDMCQSVFSGNLFQPK